MPAKVWIVGEGNNELGVGDGYGGRHRGVLEALLARVCDGGWECTGKQQWHAIQKFRAGGARLAVNHGDYLHVLGLVLRAHEDAADAVAFTRDVDSDPDREGAVVTTSNGRGEWILLHWYQHQDGEAVRAVTRVEPDADRVARLHNYFFTPDFIAEVCGELGVPWRSNGYRWFLPKG